MRNLDFNAILQLDEKLYEFEQTTAILEIMHVAHAEGDSSLFDPKTVANALYHVYRSQKKTLEEIHNLIDEK